VRAHGAAGVVVDPECVLASASRRRPPPGVRRHTALFRAHLSDEVFATVAASLAEGVGVRATARIHGIDKKTVLLVLEKAAAHVEKLSRALRVGLVVPECQLDEMWSFVYKKEKNLEPFEKLEGEFGDAWIWIAFDAVNKVVVAWVVGKRTLPHAVALVREVARVTARLPDLFSSDQLEQYPRALLEVYGRLVTPPRKPGPGRPPAPRLVPPDDLHYVQVVKRYEGSRLTQVTRKVLFGDPERIERLLRSSSVSQKINTSHVERNNGTIRHLDARCMRKTFRFSKTKTHHERELSLALAYYHLCRPHGTLTRRHGRPTTPYMAAGLTDHPWTVAELLGTRVEDLNA